MRVIKVVGAALLRGDRCFVAQRGEAMSTPMMWEFPGGKVESGELPEEALARELREELGVVVEVMDFAGQGKFRKGGLVIELDVYFARIVKGEVLLREHRDAGWFRAEEFDSLDWAEADIPVLPAVKKRLSSGV